MDSKDHELIASVIRIGFEGCPEEIEDSLKGAVIRLGVILEDDNEEFDATKFLSGCGLIGGRSAKHKVQDGRRHPHYKGRY